MRLFYPRRPVSISVGPGQDNLNPIPRSPVMSGNGEVRSPTGLPRGSWGGTLKRTVREFREDKLQHWAAALTYYAILSIFPALLVMVSLVGLVADPARVTRV